MKLSLVVTLLLGMLVGCTAQQQQAAYIAGDTIVLSAGVDDVQASLGKYSNNQEVLEELDNLQVDLTAALNGGTELLNLEIYYARATNIYTVLKAEAIERDSELSDVQRKQLAILNAQVLRLDNEVVAFKDSASTDAKLAVARELLGFAGQAVTIVKFYKGL